MRFRGRFLKNGGCRGRFSEKRGMPGTVLVQKRGSRFETPFFVPRTVPVFFWLTYRAAHIIMDIALLCAARHRRNAGILGGILVIDEGIAMGRETAEASLRMEMRRGTIVLAVLCLLSEPKYGYSLAEELAEKGLPVDTNTLYPLLRRLSSQGILSDAWELGENKPRKYYVLTEEGKTVRDALVRQWQELSASIDRMPGVSGGESFLP